VAGALAKYLDISIERLLSLGEVYEHRIDDGMLLRDGPPERGQIDQASTFPPGTPK
jgi:hypothetical protein